jgi:short-subunit dehydrogenase
MTTTREPATVTALKPVTIVTGGSDGIGRAIARRFAAQGHSLLLIARSEDRLAAAAAELRANLGADVHILPLDITAPGAAEDIDAALARAGGYANILVNNAGIGLSGAFAEHAGDDVARLLDLNVKALTLLTHHVLPGMRQRHAGGIINLASLGGYAPGPWQAVYYASKAYVLSFSEAVAAEVAADGVRVCAVAPGPVNTAFHERMGAENAWYRWLLPPLEPETVAWWADRGFKLGARVIVPGLINMILGLALRLVPHRILVPIIGWLLRPGMRENRDA